MYYNSSRHGLMAITDMPTPHIKNALAKLQRKIRKQSHDYEVIGAFKQSLAEREKFQDELKLVVNKY